MSRTSKIYIDLEDDFVGCRSSQRVGAYDIKLSRVIPKVKSILLEEITISNPYNGFIEGYNDEIELSWYTSESFQGFNIKIPSGTTMSVGGTGEGDISQYILDQYLAAVGGQPLFTDIQISITSVGKIRWVVTIDETVDFPIELFLVTFPQEAGRQFWGALNEDGIILLDSDNNFSADGGIFADYDALTHVYMCTDLTFITPIWGGDTINRHTVMEKIALPAYGDTHSLSAADSSFLWHDMNTSVLSRIQIWFINPFTYEIIDNTNFHPSMVLKCLHRV